MTWPNTLPQPLAAARRGAARAGPRAERLHGPRSVRVRHPAGPRQPDHLAGHRCPPFGRRTRRPQPRRAEGAARRRRDGPRRALPARDRRGGRARHRRLRVQARRPAGDDPRPAPAGPEGGDRPHAVRRSAAHRPGRRPLVRAARQPAQRALLPGHYPPRSRRPTASRTTSTRSTARAAGRSRATSARSRRTCASHLEHVAAVAFDLSEGARVRPPADRRARRRPSGSSRATCTRTCSERLAGHVKLDVEHGRASTRSARAVAEQVEQLEARREADALERARARASAPAAARRPGADEVMRLPRRRRAWRRSCWPRTSASSGAGERAVEKALESGAAVDRDPPPRRRPEPASAASRPSCATDARRRPGHRDHGRADGAQPRAAGHEVTRLEPLAREGGRDRGRDGSRHRRRGGAGADAVMTMLADADAVEAVVREALPALDGAVLVQMSTIGPEATGALAERRRPPACRSSTRRCSAPRRPPRRAS